jgi:PAS domain-containing protein
MPRNLRERLDAAEEILSALRSGEVDAIVASGPDGDRVYTLKGADEAYRLTVQNMAEGALAVAPNGMILFCNESFTSILAIPHERVIGSSFHDYIVPEDAGCGTSKIILKQLNEGMGFPGIGIAGMRERVRQFGGLMKIFSSSGSTRLKIILPIKRVAGSSSARL